jgi:alcohol dehydrogenase class IV
MSSILEDIYYYDAPPTRLVIGYGTVAKVAEEVRKLSISRPLIVTDPGVRDAGIVDKLLGSLSPLGLAYFIFDEVEPNPRVSTAERGAAVYRKEGCDGLISIGGGSPMDTAKAIGVLVTHPGSLFDYEGLEKVKFPIPPHIAIPTTYGTASELSFGAMITDPKRNFKASIGSRLLFPEVAIIDPELALHLPHRIAASTGMDSLTHGIETYVSRKAQPITEAISLHAVRLVSENLRKAVAGDREGTFNAMLASTMTGFCALHTRTGAVHSMAHTLGGHFDIPHGIANAILLPHVMEFNLEACPEKYREVSKAMGEEVGGLSPKEAAGKSVEAVRRLMRDLGLPTRLREVGCDREKFPQLVEDSLKSANMPQNPRAVTEDDILQLFVNAY